MRVLERFTERLIERQRELYAADAPFVEKWRTAMRYLVSEDVEPYEKIWLELQALAWNDAELRERLARGERRVARGAHRGVRASRTASSGSTMPLEALVSLVMTFNLGIMRRAPRRHRDRPRASSSTGSTGWLSS